MDAQSRTEEKRRRAARLLALRVPPAPLPRWPARPAPRDGETFALSAGQRRLWFLQQLQPHSTAYHIGFVVHLDGCVDRARLARAWTDLCVRHPVLATRFCGDPAEPRQHFDGGAVALDCHVLAGDRARLQAVLLERNAEPFDLMAGPPVRVVLFCTDDGRQSLWFCCHHILLDGRSVQRLLADLDALYAQGADALPPAPPPFAHALAWLQQVEADVPARAASQQYWLERHREPAPALQLPAPTQRANAPAHTDFFAWTGETPRALRRLARQCEATPAAVLLGLYGVLLSRCANVTDCAIGMPLDGRPLAELAEVCGFFANTVAVRGTWRPAQTIREHVRATAAALRDAQQHQFHSFDGLVHSLGLTGNSAAPPLFQAMLAYQRREIRMDSFGSLPCRMEALPTAHAKFDLTLLLDDDGDCLQGRVEHDAGRIDGRFAASLPARLESLLLQADAAPDRRLAELDTLLPDERPLLRHNVRTPAAAAPDLVTRIRRVVVDRPASIALVDAHGEWTYAQLWAAATAIAQAIPATETASRHRVLAVVANDAREQLLGLLAALLAGCAYLPLGAKLPPQRQAEILHDAAPLALLAGTSADAPAAAIDPSLLQLHFPHERPSPADDCVPPFAGRAVDGSALAYVIYTSGSTGRPKGVALARRVLDRLIGWQLDELADCPPACVAQYANVSFDVSLQEMLVSLAAGARYVALPDPQRYDFAWLVEQLDAHRIDTLFMPTAVATLFLEHLSQSPRTLPALQQLLVAGEALRLGPAHVEGWSRLPNARLANQYGPSETHVVSSDRIVRPRSGEVPCVTIGRAIEGSELWVLDRHLQPLPPGCIGELFIGGDGLADGYLGQAAQTAARFLPHPARTDGARVYRTGDLVRLRADGRIDFVGRSDHQIKIRGHRVEPGEIEQALLAQPGVRHARVVVHGSGLQASLVGYVAAAPSAAGELKAALAQRLPHYMVPAAILCVEPWPITANGKVDVRALPDPGAALDALGGYEAPRDAREKALAEVWAELLATERIGRNDDFFARGGHSLLATRMLSRLRADHGWRLSLADAFAAPRLADMAQRLVAERSGSRTPQAQAGDIGPLSFSQRRLWFLHALGDGAGAYNEQRAHRLLGDVDVDAMRASVQALLERHDALRTGFADDGHEPFQRIASVVADPLSVLDLRHHASPAAAAQASLDRARTLPFDLHEPPLLRVQLLRLGEQQWWLACTVHHIVTDGWSMNLLMRDLGDFYAQARQHGTVVHERPAWRFLDVARWERDRADAGEFDADARASADRLAGVPPLLDLPTDRPRSRLRAAAAGVVPLVFPAALDADLRAYCRRRQTTPFMVLMAAYCATLHRYSGQSDLCVGTAVANRSHLQAEDVVGFFVNTVAVRSQAPAGERVDACLARVRDAVLAALATSEVPFERVVEQLQPERNPAYAPVVQVIFNLQNTGEAGLSLQALDVAELPYRSHVTKFDLGLSLRDGGDRFVGGFEFALDLFEPATIERFGGHFLRLLGAMLAEPEREVLALEWTAPDEGAALLALGGVRTDYPRDESVVSVFRRQAARTPDAIALCCEDAVWTYAQLDAYAVHTARALAARGVEPGMTVAICLPRSMPLFGLVLGTLMAGAAYLPIDPSYPPARIEAMLADARPHCVVAAAPMAGDGVWIAPDALHDSVAEGDAAALPHVSALAAAYLMYTSGSTGRPKGIVVPHRAILRLVLGADYVDLDDRRCLLQLAPVAFDAATFEIWGALLNGGRLAIPAATHVDFAELRRLVRLHGVDTLWLTAGLFHAMIDEEPLAIAGVRQLLVGGDVVSPSHVNRALALHPGLCVINGYGPTENTTFSACAPVRAPLDARLPFPIGRPIANTRAYVLDAHLAPVPLGLPGELYVGGDGLALGYHARAAQTAAAFLPDPFATDAGARMYRTGDLVRWRPDGRLEFIGRRDGQVKLRGFRIELGEIEQVLAAHPAVRSAVAVVQDADTGKRLVAYVVADRDDLGPVLEAHAREHLPGFMVPARVMVLPALPLTPNGKVDRAALPAVTLERAGTGEAPRTPEEQAVASAFAQLLGVPVVHREDDFFALGGHSLLATRLLALLRRELGRELGLAALFQAPTVAGLAAQLATAAVAAAQIAPADRSGPLPLSFAQQRLWFLDRLGVGEGTYNVPVRLRLDGDVDAAALQWSVQQLLARHEALRTRFIERDGEPWQQVDAATTWDHAQADGRAWPECERSAWLQAAAGQGFDLAQGPLLRTRLLREGGQRWTLLLVFHHIVADGWSLGVVTRELSALYAARLRGEPATLPALPVQYADYAVWQHRQLASPAHAQSLAYWQQALHELPPLLRLPTDRPRPTVQGFRGRSVQMALPAELTQRLRAVSRGEGVTLFMTLLGGFQALLSRYAGSDDVAVGTPVANRTQAELEGLVGFFVNTLVMRGRIDWSADGHTLLQAVKAQTLAAFEHQQAPFEQLVDLLQPPRSLSYGPLIQVMFALQNAPTEGWSLPGASATWESAPTTTAKFDLTVTLAERGDALVGTLEFAEDLFDEGTVRRLWTHYAALLDALSGSLQTPLQALAWQPADEAAQCAQAAVQQSPYPDGTSLAARFLAQAQATPDAAAVQDGERTWSYAQLSAQALQIAHGLRAQGVRAGDRVAMCLPRGSELVAALLGIVAAGAVYVPLDPDHPAARLAQVLEDAQACGVIGAALATGTATTTPAQASPLRRGWSVAELQAAAPAAATWAALPPVSPAAPCYVMYTSGSTGRPKGVAVTHRGVLRLVCDTDYVPFGPGMRMAHLANPAFDAATFEIWGALLNGGCVVVIDKTTAIDPPQLRAALRATRVDTLFLTTSLFNHVARTTPDAFDGLETVVFGGEQGDAESVRLVQAQIGPTRMVNGYGPTEVTTFAVAQAMSRPAPDDLPIGRPIANTEAWVLDAALRPVPIGVVGQLYLGGPGLAAGYWGNARQTAERFVPHPFATEAGARLYATGDLARQQADGSLLFVGRVDHQVKVRGFRIELGEIEACLLRCPGVASGVVLVHAPSGRRQDAFLVAYAGGPALAETDVRAWLSTQLPEYMVPARVMVLPALPLTPNGKVDRAALPAVTLERAGTGEAPRTPEEQAVASAFAQLLGVPVVHREDDFFALGGHSLLATRLLALLRRELGRELGLAALFQAPTVAGLAAQLATAAVAAAQIAPADRSGPLPLSFAQQRLWFLDRLGVGEGTYNVPVRLRLDGDVDAAALQWSVQQLLARHEALRTRFIERDGEPWQQVDAATTWDHAQADGRAWPECERSAWLQAAAGQGFDLAQGPLLRTRLLREGGQRWTLLLVFHHIVADGWSLGVVTRELSALYAARLRGEPATLPALPVQYADYAVWQHRQLASPAHAQSLAYWQQALHELPPLLRLPTDRPRPTVQGFRGRSVQMALPAELTQRLRAVSRGEGVTLFMTLLGGFQALLSRYAGSDDVAVGTPVANRTQAELEGLVGFFVNTLVMRGRIDWSADGHTLLQAVKAQTLAAFEHQQAPFEQLVDLLQPPRSLSYGPLIQVMFALQNAPTEGWSLPGASATWESAPTTTAKFDLTVTLAERGDALVGTLEFAEDLFDEGTVRRLWTHYAALLDALSGSLQTPLQALAWQPADEAAQCAQAAVQQSPYPDGTSLAARFLAQAQATPDAAAVQDGERTWSYAQLSAQALQIAHGLRAQGVRAGDRVAMCLPRGSELVAALLGIVAAGAVYVPLDPDHPAARLAQVLEDAQACGVIGAALATGTATTTPAQASPLRRGWSVAELQAAAPAAATWAALPPVSPAAPCYVMYTSGSTGRPKGVAVTHRGVLRLVCDTDYVPFGPGMRMAHLANPAFDAATFEIWGALLNGGCVVVIDKTTAIDPLQLRATLRNARIDTLFLTTALFNHVARTAPDAFDGLPAVLFGGELGDAEAVRLVQTHGSPLRLLHAYGPTEATTFATVQRLPAPAPDDLPIGAAIANTEAWVLDAGLRPVPVGVVGQLYLGGPGLAAGYWGNARQTAERFVPHPFATAAGARLYATGDLVRQQADRSLLFVGRVDHQVKVRGFRIELGEIEAALLRCPGVTASVVQVHAPGGRRQDAYLVAHAGGADLVEAEVRTALSAQLPEYMLPARIVVLPALPLTPNGKVDRAALPAPAPAAAAGEAPRTPQEQAVASAFAQLLDVPVVHRDDNFFALGGHSLLAVRLRAQLQREHGVDLPLVDLMRACTPAALAARLAAATGTTAEPVLRTLREGSADRTLILLPPAGGNTLCYREFVRALTIDAQVLALDLPARLDGRPCAEWFATYADAVVAAGVVAPTLLGWSFGGVLAYGLAQELQRRGERSRGVVMLDSDPRWVRADEGSLDDTALRALVANAFAGADAAALAPDPALHAQWQRHLHALQALRDHRFDGQDPGRCHLLTTPRTRSWLADAWRPLMEAPPHDHTIDAAHDALLEHPAVAVVARWVEHLLMPAPYGEPAVGADAARTAPPPATPASLSL